MKANTVKKIKLTQGRYALVDDEDFNWLNQWKWCFDRSNGYAHRNQWVNGKNRKIYMHRIILGNPRGILIKVETDHKNRNKLDNNIENLELIKKEEHSRIHAIENGLGKDRIGVSPTNKIKKEIIQTIKDLKKNGFFLREIQNKLNLSYPTIQKYAKEIK